MSGRIYEPIGYCCGTGFSGSFNGNYHKIQNLSITGSSYLGCFGAIDSMGSVQNLGLENITITSGTRSAYLGGLCGVNEGTITNCYSGGSVTGGSGSCFLGGLCGNNYEGTITDCYATSSVTGGYYIGGMSGKNYCGTITNCYSDSSVTGVNYSGSLGGLCGFNCNGTVTNCYSGGSVTGGNNSLFLGGLCGSNGDWSHPDSTITNCYATGLVTGNSQLGGLCGENQCGTISNCYATGSVTGNISLGGMCGVNSGTFTGCFWDVETGGPDNGIGTPKTTVEMQTESTFTDANWDFSVVPVWRMPFEATGYPMLGWQKDIPGDFTGRYGVDMVDFAVLADTWGLSSGQAGDNDLCDLIDDDTIDLDDLVVFVENWLAGK
jgi:The GLUG motif